MSKIRNFDKIYKRMIPTFPKYFKILLTVVCLIIVSNTYSQNKDNSNRKVFDRKVMPSTLNPTDGRIRCVTTEYEQFLQEKNPKRMSSTQFEKWLTPLVAKQKIARANAKTTGTVIIIPVVVHVIYSDQAIGVAPNIVDAQVESQITVLNQDFRKMFGTPGYNTNPVGADTEIQFVLAKVDPYGNPTNGIDRKSFCQEAWADTEIESTLKPATIWDPTQYLNMWTLKFTDSDLLGYAQFPDASGLPGLDPSGGTATTDGVVSSYDVFGSKTFDTNSTFLLDVKYNKGRTMSHEVGHWLGLIHIWGDETCGTDYCADTPTHHEANYDCPTKIPLSCDPTPVNEMIQNYMDYTDDICMNIFTLNQKDRITTIINNAARRSSLKTSTKGTAIPLVGNDAEVKLEKNCTTSSCNSSANLITQKITIYNRGSNNLTSASLIYSVNGGNATTYNWTGNLATNASASFNITFNASANGTITVSIISANGTTDGRASNNNASTTFTLPAALQNFTYTNFIFRLQRDLWGSETAWNLKDNSGTILYSSSKYTDKDELPLPQLITQEWILANNKCYTFTITDTQGDGICCGDSGDGYYDIKTNNGEITVKYGTNFGASDTITFTTDTLGIYIPKSIDDVYIYPNPSKENLTIYLPEGFGLPDNYTITNSLGQVVIDKKITKYPDVAINTNSLSAGVYFIKITKDEQTKTLKFIKE